jgi:hypothetical protein
MATARLSLGLVAALALGAGVNAQSVYNGSANFAQDSLLPSVQARHAIETAESNLSFALNGQHFQYHEHSRFRAATVRAALCPALR